MGKSMPKAPPAPDPYAVAQAQTNSNVKTGVANTLMGNANQYTPFGTVTNSIREWRDLGDGNGIPLYDQTITLSPEQQRMLDQQNAIGIGLGDQAISQIGRVGGILNSSLAVPPTLQQLGGAPDLQTNVSLGRAPTSFGDVGSAARGFGDAGLITSSVGDAGWLQRGVGDGSRASTTFGDAGQIQRSVGPNDFSADGQRVRDAMMARLSPGLKQDRDALETQLVNQGLTRGTPAFNAAMDEASRRENDARLAVDVAGGQEQSRLFSDNLAAGNFANSAQAQAYEQAFGRGSFANSAIAQNFGQDLAAGQFGNAAQQQSFNQLMARADLANGAQQQGYEQLLGRGQFYNQGQQQDFDQEQTRALYGLDTTRLNNAAALDEATFRNNSLGSLFQLGQAATGFNNNVGQQSWQNDLTARTQPINEISALMGLGQVQVPQGQPFQAGEVAGTPVGQYVYQSAQMQQDAWKSQVAAKAQSMGSLFGLGASLVGGALAKSDRRMKDAVRDLGIRLANGLKLYAYRYLGDPEGAPEHVGVMADEVARVRPGAVFLMPTGFLSVDYAQVV